MTNKAEFFKQNKNEIVAGIIKYTPEILKETTDDYPALITRIVKYGMSEINLAEQNTGNITSFVWEILDKAGLVELRTPHTTQIPMMTEKGMQYLKLIDPQADIYWEIDNGQLRSLIVMPNEAPELLETYNQ